MKTGINSGASALSFFLDSETSLEEDPMFKSRGADTDALLRDATPLSSSCRSFVWPIPASLGLRAITPDKTTAWSRVAGLPLPPRPC